MALTAIYQRLPISGGDNNAYHIPVMQNMRRGSIGANSIDISNVAGALNIDLGFAGINDGTANGEGVLQITVGGSFSLAGSTAGLWHAFEFEVSGAGWTPHLTALAGETDESFMSLTMKGYYDAAKCGYYRIASRRVLAFVFIRAGTVLGRIVNTENGVLGFKGITIEDYVSSAGVQLKNYIAQIELESGPWNMDSTALIDVNLPFSFNSAMVQIQNILGIIFSDAGGIYDFQSQMANLWLVIANNSVRFNRVGGGFFDGVAFDDAIMNRMLFKIKWRT